MDISSNTTLARWREQLRDPGFRRGFAGGAILIILALVVNYFAALYAMERASSSVTDIVLSNIPTFEVEDVFVWGPMLFATVIAIVSIRDPKRIPYILKSVALFVLIRSFFVSLTHIGPFPDHIALDLTSQNWLQHTFDYFRANPTFAFLFTSGSDLFFSGHTGLPFLLALVFWHDRPMRVFCLASSIFFGVIVLLAHLHYSIDVASAFFITYTISHIGSDLFRKDKLRFDGGYSQGHTADRAV